MPIDLDEYRRDSRANWEGAAANWDDERDFLTASMGAVAEAMVNGLDPNAGDTVLELACGTGDAGILAAERVGAGGSVIQTDFAAAMVDAAKRRVGGLDLENVEHRVLDAESMDLEDDSVDGALCRFGYMLMADPAQALAETRRVLKGGSRLAFAVWGPPDKNLWAAIPGMTLVAHGKMPPPEPGTPGIFALGDPDRIRELVIGAGFGDPRIEQVKIEWPYDDTEIHWEKTLKLAAPIAAAVAELDEDEREQVRTEIADAMNEHAFSDGPATGLVHVVVAA